ncbi:phage antirepressor N-terminal domain-containing protein [Sphingobacterium multivorum]|uniref:phage antirepressor N-terminal domain-containing protein n=1 Tax=Sphingobacterium multivorum TaxID=28454 RepID=UPI003DA263AA
MNNQKSVGFVNKVSILLIEQEGEKLIPIKPICEALGIDDKAQRDKIKDDEILNSVGVLSPSTGADQKQYEMFCLPLKYVFGWLFTINPKNVKEEARQAVTMYRQECYDVLFKHFVKYQDFVVERSKQTDHYFDRYRAAQISFKEARDIMQNAQKELERVRKYTFEEYEASGDQMKLDFPEEQEVK